MLTMQLKCMYACLHIKMYLLYLNAGYTHLIQFLCRCLCKFDTLCYLSWTPLNVATLQFQDLRGFH